MIEIGRRRRSQPPPPHIVFEALANPDHDPRRPWLHLLDDEQRPSVLRAFEPHALTRLSLWIGPRDAVIEFALDPSISGSSTATPPARR